MNTPIFSGLSAEKEAAFRAGGGGSKGQTAEWTQGSTRDRKTWNHTRWTSVAFPVLPLQPGPGGDGERVCGPISISKWLVWSSLVVQAVIPVARETETGLHVQVCQGLGRVSDSPKQIAWDLVSSFKTTKGPGASPACRRPRFVPLVMVRVGSVPSQRLRYVNSWRTTGGAIWGAGVLLLEEVRH